MSRCEDSRRDPVSDAVLLSSIREDISSIYTDVLQRPMPTHLADLLARLERETAA